MPGADHWETLEDVRAEALVCCRCDLCHGRTHVVFGEGSAPARMMIVGEGPGADEDREGRPFTGRSGRLLDTVLAAAGVDRGEVWVTNVVRCRPTVRDGNSVRNRAPTSREAKACDLWMSQELAFVSPEVIVCLGLVPARALISRDFAMTVDHGKRRTGRGGVVAIATFHPAYALRMSGGDRARIQALMTADFETARRALEGSADDEVVD